MVCVSKRIKFYLDKRITDCSQRTFIRWSNLCKIRKDFILSIQTENKNTQTEFYNQKWSNEKLLRKSEFKSRISNNESIVEILIDFNKTNRIQEENIHFKDRLDNIFYELHIFNTDILTDECNLILAQSEIKVIEIMSDILKHKETVQIEMISKLNAPNENAELSILKKVMPINHQIGILKYQVDDVDQNREKIIRTLNSIEQIMSGLANDYSKLKETEVQSNECIHM